MQWLYNPIPGFDGVSYQRVWPDGNNRGPPASLAVQQPADRTELQRQLHAHGAGPTAAIETTPAPHNRRGLHPARPRRRSARPPSTRSFSTLHGTPRPRVLWAFGNDLPGGKTSAATHSTARCSPAPTWRSAEAVRPSTASNNFRTSSPILPRIAPLRRQVRHTRTAGRRETRRPAVALPHDRRSYRRAVIAPLCAKE